MSNNNIWQVQNKNIKNIKRKSISSITSFLDFLVEEFINIEDIDIIRYCVETRKKWNVDPAKYFNNIRSIDLNKRKIWLDDIDFFIKGGILSLETNDTIIQYALSDLGFDNLLYALLSHATCPSVDDIK